MKQLDLDIDFGPNIPNIGHVIETGLYIETKSIIKTESFVYIVQLVELQCVSKDGEELILVKVLF